MQVRGCLDMERQRVSARLGKVLQVAVRLGDHQVNVERQVRHRADGLDDDRPHGNVRYKVPIHHIDMDEVSSGSFRGPDLIAEAREVCRQYGGCNLDVSAHDAESLTWAHGVRNRFYGRTHGLLMARRTRGER